MNALARYLLVFILGWSGAVFTYSDLIYPNKNAPSIITPSEKEGSPDKEVDKPLVETNDISSSE